MKLPLTVTCQKNVDTFFMLKKLCRQFISTMRLNEKAAKSLHVVEHAVLNERHGEIELEKLSLRKHLALSFIQRFLDGGKSRQTI